MSNYSYIKPGTFELYCGPMKSGKSKELISRADKFKFIEDISISFFKASIDTRNTGICSRFLGHCISCELLDVSKPETLLELLDQNTNVVFIDELNFFEDSIVDVIEELMVRGIHVIGGGLDLSFRGDTFGPMGKLSTIATEIHKLTAICDYPKCNNVAIRTQRLVDFKPAHYDSPLVLIGDNEEGYECRCIKHHFVPGRPKYLEKNLLTNRTNFL